MPAPRQQSLLHRIGKMPTPDLSVTERAVWMAYAAHANTRSGNRAYPKATTLAGIVGCTDRAVRLARAPLVAGGT